ncbi:MAG: hypothetical protein J1E06_03735 [Acutalibacter sp.]|nr:hypothetical protein [Acutalibacter sp.]
MKNILKKVLAAVLCAALCLSLSGCYSANMAWSAKRGQQTLPIGSYIYYLNSSLSEAREKVSTDEEVLTATIDGKDGKTWIEDRARDYLGAYFYVNRKFDELALEFSEEELSSLDSNTDFYWSYYQSMFEEMGVARESFHLAFTEYNSKLRMLMVSMYDTGGELEIPNEELESYFTDNYFYYSYFSAPLTNSDEDGNSVDLTDEEKADLKEKLQGYVKSINSGDMTLEEAASAYAEENLGGEDNSTYREPFSALKTDLTEDLSSALEGAKDKEAVLVELASSYLVVVRQPVMDGFAAMFEEETGKDDLIIEMKNDEFSDYVIEQGKKIEDLEINTAALNRVKLSSMITDSNKYGTAAAEDDTSADS